MNADEMRAMEALRALRQADAKREAPASVESAVLDAFAGQRRRRSLFWPLAVAAAIAAVAVALWMARPRPHQAETPRTHITAPPPSAPIPVRRERPPIRAVAHHRRRAVRRPAVPQPSSIVAQFIPVPYAPPLPSGEIRIVRVSMSPELVQQWALGGGATQADLVIGEDGIVRAVRWIR